MFRGSAVELSAIHCFQHLIRLPAKKRRGLLGNAGPRNMEHVEDKASGRVCLGRQVFGHKGCNYCSVSLEFVYGSDTHDSQARPVEVSCYSFPWRGVAFESTTKPDRSQKPTCNGSATSLQAHHRNANRSNSVWSKSWWRTSRQGRKPHSEARCGLLARNLFQVGKPMEKKVILWPAKGTPSSGWFWFGLLHFPVIPFRVPNLIPTCQDCLLSSLKWASPSGTWNPWTQGEQGAQSQQGA